jgi:dihydrofolate synthase/folylpolyglutamate synthase
MTFDEAVRHIGSLHRFAAKPGLSRMTAIVERLGHPQRSYPVAHITGTKGKGSTTAMLAAMLRAHGFRVGGYFSPYVFDIRERIQVDGEMVSHDDFARLAAEVLPVTEEAARVFGPPTEFEFKTAMGLLHFAQSNVDFACIEVGIGGRLDSTNVVDGAVSVITNVGLDHTHILGETTTLIAGEKAGILRAGRPCISAVDDLDARRVIQDRCRELGSPLVPVGFAGVGEAAIQVLESDSTFVVRTPKREYGDLKLRMPGRYQFLNAACAMGAAEALEGVNELALDPDLVREGLLSAFVPGRMQIVRHNPTVILDGAHNAMASQALADELERIPHEKLILVVGMAVGHSPREFLEPLAKLAPQVVATQPEGARAQRAEAVAEAAAELGLDAEVVTPSQSAALLALEKAGERDLVVVTGSFYTVGDMSGVQW